MSGHQFLHPILPCEFLDSPEFESSRATIDEKFKVSTQITFLSKILSRFSVSKYIKEFRVSHSSRRNYIHLS